MELLKKLISIIIPAYNEEENISELTQRLQKVFDILPRYDFEVVVVENGSKDNTFMELQKVHDNDPRFKILQLARNFRMDGGLTAGLNFIKGEAAILMTADLQDPPELIPIFLEKWEEGYENVYGIVSKRQGTNPVRKLNSRLFYMVANVLTGGMIPRNVSDFRLVDIKIYTAINSMQERNRFMRGLFAWLGFRSVGIKYERMPRFRGTSGAHTFKVIELALKGIFAHSYIPLKFISLAGVSISVISFIFFLWILFKVFILGDPFPGFGTIMAVMLMMFGILFTMLGIVSEYIGMIYEEVKQRPNFVVRQKVGL